MARRTLKLSGLFAALFFTALMTTLLVSIATPDVDVSEQEKRTLQTWPKWSERESLKAYLRQLSDYANDQFGFREQLIKLYNKASWSLGESPSDTVIRGNNDWLFLKIKDPMLSQHKYSRTTVENIIKRRVEYIRKMKSELEARGIVYRHIIASNKMSVYSEHLPAIYALTNINASLEHFKSLIDPELAPLQIYTDEIVNAVKPTEPEFDLYFKNDSHWNDYGAYQVFMEVLRSLDQKSSKLALDPIAREFKVFEKFSGDLAQYIGLNDQLMAMEPYTEFLPCAQPDNQQSVRWDLGLAKCDRNETKILIIGDSFLVNFYPYFAESVGELYVIRQKTSRTRLLQLIDAYQPDIVLEEIVERNLAQPIPH